MARGSASFGETVRRAVKGVKTKVRAVIPVKTKKKRTKLSSDTFLTYWNSMSSNLSILNFCGLQTAETSHFPSNRSARVMLWFDSWP